MQPKTYKVVLIQEPDIVDLIDTENKTVRIMASPGDFMEGEIVTEEDFYIHKCLILNDESNIDQFDLAFRIHQF